MQSMVDPNSCNYNPDDENNSGSLVDTNTSQIDLLASDKILFSDISTMFEIKYPAKDIRVNVKLK